MKIDIIAGARPNFMKIGPLIHAITKHNNSNKGKKIHYRLIHTGQHYDKAMSSSFFEQLNIPEPDINLGAGGGTQAEQTAAIMTRYEQILDDRPDICIVVGDVTSTMACAIVAKKANIRVAHIEAGIRSGDITMPEEINRIVTDSITDHYFTTSIWAGENLLAEGKSSDKIHFVGNTMIDSLLSNISRLQRPELFDNEGLEQKEYILMTLHRPANVDGPENLERLLSAVSKSAKGKQLVFPMHPRTKNIFEQIDQQFDNIHIAGPMPYLEFIYLLKNSAGVITDSGGITEEATVLNVPCITLRDSTERPETVEIGTNELIGTDLSKIDEYVQKILVGDWKKGSIPEKWDGETSARIVDILKTL